jgi:hypothetical protein
MGDKADFIMIRCHDLAIPILNCACEGITAYGLHISVLLLHILYCKRFIRYVITIL